MSRGWERGLGGRLPSLETWMTLVASLPVPLWFAFQMLSDTGAAWRAVYFSERTFSGGRFAVTERQLEHYWDRRYPTTPGGLQARTSSARYETCLQLTAAREIPFMLVANGVASFAVNGVAELSGAHTKDRWVRGKVLSLPAGAHHLSVEFAARGWPSIALLASLDGSAPVALGSGALHAGATTWLPPAGGASCSSKP